MRARIARTYRKERRRLATLAVLAFVSGVFLYGHLGSVGPVPISLIAGTAYVVLILPAAFLVFLIAPAQAPIVEAMAVARFGVALAVTWIPGSSVLILNQPVVMATIMAFCGLVAHILLRRMETRAPNA